MTTVQNKLYDESNTTAEEAETIRSRVQIVQAGIAYYEELPRQSAYSVQLLGEGLARATSGMGRFALVVDLSHAGLPSAKVREALRTHLFSAPRLEYVAVFTGRNYAITLVARLVLSQVLSAVEYSVSSTREEALGLARRQIAGEPVFAS